MHNDARGGDPVTLDSLLSGLEDKQQFDAWAAMQQLGMLNTYEIAYDIVAHRFCVVAPVDCEGTDEPS